MFPLRQPRVSGLDRGTPGGVAERITDSLDDTKWARCLCGIGEMGDRIRSFDWSSNPLGPISAWPSSLRGAVSLCLRSRFQLAIYWGPQLVLLYNDAERDVLGGMHPWALGRPAAEILAGNWDVLGPMLHGVLAGGEATWSVDQPLRLNRRGVVEESFFTYSYSPIPDGDHIGGVLLVTVETTERVLAERRLRTLRGLAAELANVQRADEVCLRAAGVLAENGSDLPFSLLFLEGAEGGFRLCASSGIAEDPNPDNWPLREVASSQQAVLVEDAASRLRTGEVTRPRTALVLPIAQAGNGHGTGCLVAGLNNYRRLDETYRSFLGLVAGQIATAIAAARALEEERRRSKAVAELDAAKTAFFANVSHEIPEEELPRLFERFHQVQGVSGRSLEGTGIGLALVQELVRLHGGAIRVESTYGRGSTFIVSVPLGSPTSIPDPTGAAPAPPPSGAGPYVAEATRWLPDHVQSDAGPSARLNGTGAAGRSPHGPGVQNGAGARPRVLVADDNADMRQYLGRLLAGAYHVEGVADGQAALAASRERPPDLVLADVMMPELDGFGLLRELEERIGERTRELSQANKRLVQQVARRKQVENARTALMRRLVHAQEEEHRRIARELHDDLTQRLAVLAIDAGVLEQAPGCPTDVQEKARGMREQLVSLSEGVHSLSRQLHPSILDELGLVDALRAECLSLGQRDGIAVRYLAHDVPTGLSPELALCVYRVTQEALRNVARHAKARRASVRLFATDRHLVLRVRDRGVGFGVAAPGKLGLGLESMRERARLVRARLTIASRPGEGTNVTLRVPLERSRT
jgi:signal transduction histidine kinase